MIAVNRPRRWGWLFLGIGSLVVAAMHVRRMILETRVARSVSDLGRSDLEQPSSEARAPGETPSVSTGTSTAVEPTEYLAIPGGLRPKIIDQHVRFTVYRPEKVRPETWYTMLAFAYRGADPEEGGSDIKASFQEVEDRATAMLGPQIQPFQHESSASSRRR
jgi:hypothetical protein